MNMIRNLSLLLVTCLVGFVLCEGALRLFYPKYAPLAEAQARFDTMRLWARTANNRDYSGAHPDTGLPHAVHHNNLGLMPFITTISASGNTGTSAPPSSLPRPTSASSAIPSSKTSERMRRTP